MWYGILYKIETRGCFLNRPLSSGDSGGIVYTWVGGFPHAVIGIHIGSNAEGTLVSTFHEINRRLGTRLR